MAKSPKKLVKSIKIFNSYNFNAKAFPINATIFTSHKCNLGCAMCWRNTKSGEDRLNWEPVPIEIWERTIKELKEMGCNKLQISGGGEPLLDKNFGKLAKLAKKIEMECQLTTNGTLLNKEIVDFLNEIKWDTVIISLDAPDKETNNKIRGWGFDQVIENIKYISKTNRTFSVYLQSVILPINYKKFTDLLKICNKYKLDGIVFLPFCDFKEYTNNFYENYNIPKTREEFESFIMNVRKEFIKLDKIAKTYKLNTNIHELLVFNLIRRAPFDTCYNPWMFCVIDESGNVIPCCQLSNINKKFYLGNIRENNIREIWFGKKFELLRRRFKKRILYDDCNNCIASKFNERIGIFLDPIKTISAKHKVKK
ncbi:MAG: hypothetical protein A2Y66_02120 [Nitrospirae bacterium RBG_13_41_22]|nr:MAG: hypothetical protein A2Y66_02120 [Nitrospirae bacterium RBG_13_41_22]